MVQMRYFLKLAYNGKNFHGWQLQDNAITVQQVLNEIMSIYIGETIELTGCGRTDTGVHAKEFFAHFDMSRLLSDEEKTKAIYKLNCFLKKDIVIYDIITVNPEAHARFDATSRTYNYIIYRNKNPFNTEPSYYYPFKLDVELMNRGAALLFNYTDFSCFSKSNTQVYTNNCTIMEAYWKQNEDELIFTIKADRFLRNMVRAIVGTMLDLGNGRISIDDLKNIIENKNRSDAGFSVPAHALFLTKVEYPYL